MYHSNQKFISQEEYEVVEETVEGLDALELAPHERKRRVLRKKKKGTPVTPSDKRLKKFKHTPPALVKR